MIRRNESGQTELFIMEPEDELKALKFISFHRPLTLIVEERDMVLWDPCLSLTEQAEILNLRGGHQYHFHGLTQGDFA